MYKYILDVFGIKSIDELISLITLLNLMGKN